MAEPVGLSEILKKPPEVAPENPLVNPNIFALEEKPKPTLMHDVGAGAACINCSDKCPGLDLHFWRKICKACKCSQDDHMLLPTQDPGNRGFTIGRLSDHENLKTFLTGVVSYTKTEAQLRPSIVEIIQPQTPQYPQKIKPLTPGTNSTIYDGRATEFESPSERPVAAGNVKQAAARFEMPRVAPKPFVSADSEKEQSQQQQLQDDTQMLLEKYDWIPHDQNGVASKKELIEKYMQCLNESDRPITDSQGGNKRVQLLKKQLPLHDSVPEKCNQLSEAETKAMGRYTDLCKETVIGVGFIMDKPDLDQKNIRDCATCENPFKSNHVGVVTKHGLKQAGAFHPDCFRCDICKDLLVDMVYFYSEDCRYLCGRHFGETQYPRCGSCDELIFAKEYTHAEEKDWHLTHFCCFGCDKELGGHRYMMKEGQPHCLQCYMEKYAKTCGKCQLKIEPDVRRISHKDQFHWHATVDCFQCYTCRKSLLGGSFVMKAGKTFCSTECKIRAF